MGLSLFLVSVFARHQNSKACLAWMMIFTCFFQTTMAPCHWVYLPEILTDAQFGFVATFHYCNGVELSLVTEYMIKGWKTEGTFLFYSLFTFSGVFWFYYVVKETMGLTDK